MRSDLGAIADFEGGGRGCEPEHAGCLSKMGRAKGSLSLRASRINAALLRPARSPKTCMSHL